MANVTLNIKVNTVLDSGAFSAVTTKLKTAFESVANAMQPGKAAELASQFTTTATSAGKFATGVTEAAVKVDGLKQKVDEFAGLTIDKFGKVRDEQGRFAKGFEVIGGEIKKAGDGAGTNFFSGLKKSFAEGQSAGAAGGGIFGSIASSLGSLINPAGLATAAVGLLTAGFLQTVTIGKEFETGLAAVSAITGITGTKLDDIGNRAQDLAAKFGGSASTQLTSFQGVLSRFGADLAKYPKDLGAVSESINVLAKAGGIDAATSMDTLTTAMLQFGVNTSNSAELAAESARFINVMAASARVGAAEIPQVGEAVKVAGVAMKGAKVSFEEGNAAIQVLAAGGKVGAEAGTALRNVLGKIAGEEVIPKEALSKLKSLGVDMKLVSDTSLPVAERFKELSKASKDATAFAQVFGAENAAAATILANGAGTIAQWTEEITGTSDATIQATVNMATLSEQLERGKASIENLAIDSYKVLSPILSGLISSVTGAFGLVSDALGPIFSKLSTTIGGVFSRLSSIVAPILGIFGGIVITQIVATFSAAATVLNVFYETGVKVFDKIVAALQPLIGAFKSAFGITDDVQKTFDPLKTLQSILGGVTDAIGAAGAILSEIGGLLAEVLGVGINIVVGAFELLFKAVKATVDVFSPAKSAIADTGAAVQKTGGFFDTFVNIVKTAPDFIRAVTAGFKAFVGAIGDVITNFSFEKLKDLISGKTALEAFNGSVNATNTAKNLALTEKQFQDTRDRIQAIADLANKNYSEREIKAYAEQRKISVDAARAELIQKQINAVNDLEAQKTSALTRLQQREQAGQIEKQAAQKIREEIQSINLAAKKKEDDDEAAIDAKSAETKKARKVKELKDLSDEINKVRLENSKIVSDMSVKEETDEATRARSAAEEKANNAVQAVRNEAAKVAAEENVSNAQRNELLAELMRKEQLTIEQGYAERLVVERKLASDALTQRRQATLAAARAEVDAQKAVIEEKSELLKAAADADRRAELVVQVAQEKARLVALQGEEEKAAIEAKNKKLGDAEKALVEARANQEVAAFRAAQEKAKNAVLDSLGDATIGAGSGFGISQSTAQMIQDAQAEVDAAQAAFDEVRAAVVSTDSAIVAAAKKAQAEQTKILKEATAERDKIILDSSAVYRTALAIQLNLEKQFSDDAIAERKRIAAENDKALQSAEEALFTSLKNRTLDEKGYYSAINDLEKKRAAAASDSMNFLKVANTALVDALKESAAGARQTISEAQKLIRDSYSKTEKDAKGSYKNEEERTAARSQLYEGLALNMGLTFAGMVASGEDAVSAAQKVVLGAAADFLTAMMPTWVAGIFGSFATSGPIGIALAGLATGVLIGLVQAAKAALVGAHHGVIGIDENYNVRPSHEDTIPVMVRKNESIITPEGTNANRDLLEFINRTGRPAEDYFAKAKGYDSPELKSAVQALEQKNNQLETALAASRAKIREFENAFAVSRENYSSVRDTAVNVSVQSSRAVNSDALVMELRQQTVALVNDNKSLRAQLRQEARVREGQPAPKVNVQVVMPNTINQNW